MIKACTFAVIPSIPELRHDFITYELRSKSVEVREVEVRDVESESEKGRCQAFSYKNREI
ncbi:hypothetical protein D3C78_1825580 [compost metagenome]